MFSNPTTISTNFTTTAGYNYMSVGPITINTGVSVTITTGTVWTVV